MAAQHGFTTQEEQKQQQYKNWTRTLNHMKSVKIVSLNAVYSLECADIRDIIKCWKQHHPKEEEKKERKKTV